MQLRIDIRPRAYPGLSLFLRLDMLLLLLLVVESLDIQLVLKQLVLIEVVRLLPLLHIRHLLLHRLPDLTRRAHFVRTWAWQ